MRQRDQRDLGRPVPPRKNISIVPSGKSAFELRPVPPLLKGRFAIVTNVRRDAVDAATAQDERRQRVRQSRVVLTPRRWRQVGGRCSADDGGKKARSPGRARNKPLRPLRAGTPGDPAYLW